MRTKKLLTLATLFIIMGGSATAKDYTVTSPNGQNVVTVSDDLTISVSHAGKQVVNIQPDLITQESVKKGKISPTLGINHSHTGNKIFPRWE